MDAELKAKWVAALRSGEYRQTQEALRKRRDSYCGYCCLGVLLDVSGEGEWSDDDGVFLLNAGEYDSLESDLGYHRAALGISKEQEAELINMNDEHENTFPEIADWIEANL